MYFYAALFFCWRIRSVSASSQLRQVSNVRTRPHLAPRVLPFENYGGEGRRPNEAPVYGGASGGRQPVDQEPNAGSGHGSPQQGSLFDLTEQSHGVDAGNTEQWSDVALGNWQWQEPTTPSYAFVGYPDMVMTPHDTLPNVPAKLEPPASVRSQTKRPQPRTPNPRGRPKMPSDTVGSGDAEYKSKDRRRTQIRLAQRAYRERKENLINFLKAKDAESQAKIEALQEEVARLQSQVSSSYTSDAQSELDRSVVSEMNYQQSLPENTASGIDVPVGEPDGGSFRYPQEDGWDILRGWLDVDGWGPSIGPPQRLTRSLRYNNNKVSRPNTGLRARRRSQSPQNPPNDPVAEFKYYANVYTQLRSNVSELLFPYFSKILSYTNSSSIYEMLRSVHSDLVAAGPWTIGPYSNGANCFDWIEEQLFGNITNSTLQNDTIVGVLVYNDMLIEIYSDVWGNASYIANQTGYLKQMSTVRKYLNPTNTSLLPDTWKTAQPLPKSLDFDALYGKYNRTLSWAV